MKKKLVFGTGPGRCGSASLAFLLNAQESSLVSHELFPVLPWDIGDASLVQFRWEQLHHQSHLFDMVGDVGNYYLPYISFLMKSLAQVEHLKHGFDFKFILLERDIEEIVKSFLVKFQRQNNNPLQNHEDPSLNRNDWDGSFPKYDGCSLEEATRNYATDYYEEAQKLMTLFPSSVKIFNVESLNSEDGVSSILNFIGIENPRVFTKIKKNAS